MAPHKLSHWDFWRIGGRWCGILTGYDPRGNPKNYVKCDTCAKKRKHSPCPVCIGKGKYFHLKEIYHGDVMPVHMIEWTEDRIPYSLLLPDGTWHRKPVDTDIKNESQWGEQVKQLLEDYSDTVAVVVDYYG